MQIVFEAWMSFAEYRIEKQLHCQWVVAFLEDFYIIKRDFDVDDIDRNIPSSEKNPSSSKNHLSYLQRPLQSLKAKLRYGDCTS